MIVTMVSACNHIIFPHLMKTVVDEDMETGAETPNPLRTLRDSVLECWSGC